jgi:hypothetical protein
MRIKGCFKRCPFLQRVSENGNSRWYRAHCEACVACGWNPSVNNGTHTGQLCVYTGSRELQILIDDVIVGRGSDKSAS